MPFSNTYNESIKEKLLAIANRKIAHDKMIAHNPTSAEPKSQQDFISVTHPELEGGSGNLANTSFDLGIEKKRQLEMGLPLSSLRSYEQRN